MDETGSAVAGLDAFKDWLSPSTWQVEAQLLANRSQRAEGTISWVLELEAFKTWRLGRLAGRDSTGTSLWISGLPGAGKSTISAFLYDILKLQYPDSPILHFFCKSGSPGLSTCADILRTVCFQLLERDPFIQRYLRDRPSLPSSSGNKSTLLMFNTLIKEPLLASRPKADVFVLIDGVDELEAAVGEGASPQYDAKTDIEVLLEQLTSLARVKVLVTSRPSPQLRKILTESGVTHSISRGDNADDLKRFVTARVASSPRLRSGFDDLDTSPIEVIAEKANGIFLWTALMLDMLERTVSAKAFKATLEETPSTMDRVYDEVLQRSRESGNYKWIKEIVGFVMAAASPLTVSEIKTAVELSLQDEMYNMEDFLRSECGTMLDLIPKFGPNPGTSYEVQISHETFQAYLIDPTKPHGEIFSPAAAHAKLALACLRRLMTECGGAENDAENGFAKYAISRWRWHLRLSMSVPERDWCESPELLDDGIPLPNDLAAELSDVLHEFIASDFTRKWLEHILRSGPSYEKPMFWKIYHTCVEVSAWYRCNRACRNGAEDPGLLVDEQTVFDLLWSPICRTWVWNTLTDLKIVETGYASLTMLWVWGGNPGILAETEEVAALLKSERRIQESNKTSTIRSSGKLHGNLTVRFANYVLAMDKELYGEDRILEIANSGDFDEMSGVCMANLSVAYWYAHRRQGLPDDVSRSLRDKAWSHIQEALEEEPDTNPRYYEQLGNMHSWDDDAALAQQAWKKGGEIDAANESSCREHYYQHGVWAIAKWDVENPDYPAAITLLREAIREDPRHATNRWFHQLVTIYKKVGDMESARQTMREEMEFDPSRKSKWEDIASTYFESKEWEERRSFDWRSFCDALYEGIQADPKRANNLWCAWWKKGDTMRDRQCFDLAVGILRYGLEKIAEGDAVCDADERAQFEHHLGETFCGMARWDDAIPVLEDSVTRLGGEAKKWHVKPLAEAYTSAGRYDEALALYERYICKDGVQPEGSGAFPFDKIGEINIERGNLDKAVSSLKKAVRGAEARMSRCKKDPDGGGWYDFWSEQIGANYLDLGLVYRLTGREAQARKCFEKAAPLVAETAEYHRKDREEGEHAGYVHRSEGRTLARLAWAYELLGGAGDARALEAYKKAVWLFETAVWANDDFFEEAECRDAKAALERVTRGEGWVFPGQEADRELRRRARVWNYRTNWGVELERRKREGIVKPR